MEYKEVAQMNIDSTCQAIGSWKLVMFAPALRSSSYPQERRIQV